MNKHCIGCGIGEEEANAKGDISVDIPFKDDAINLERVGIVLKENQFLCITCRSHLVNTVTGGILDKFISGSIAFETFVSSSAQLFKLEKIEVVQACYNLFEAGLMTIGGGEDVISLLEITKKKIEINIELVKKEMEKTEGSELAKIIKEMDKYR